MSGNFLFRRKMVFSVPARYSSAISSCFREVKKPLNVVTGFSREPGKVFSTLTVFCCLKKFTSDAVEFFLGPENLTAIARGVFPNRKKFPRRLEVLQDRKNVAQADKSFFRSRKNALTSCLGFALSAKWTLCINEGNGRRLNGRRFPAELSALNLNDIDFRWKFMACNVSDVIFHRKSSSPTFEAAIFDGNRRPLTSTTTISRGNSRHATLVTSFSVGNRRRKRLRQRSPLEIDVHQL